MIIKDWANLKVFVNRNLLADNTNIAQFNIQDV